MSLNHTLSTLAFASLLGLTLASPGLSQTAADSDGDGVPDSAEVLLGTDPMVADTDGDGQNDLMDADPVVKSWMSPTMYESYVSVKRTEIAIAKDLSDAEICARYARVY